MAWLTDALQVLVIPEQPLVSAVRFLVVGNEM
jgi:hypothetical protein